MTSSLFASQSAVSAWSVNATTSSQVGSSVNTKLRHTHISFLASTHQHSGCGRTPCSAFPQEYTVDPWWRARELRGSAAASATRTSTETRRSTPTLDSLQSKTHQNLQLHVNFKGNDFCDSIKINSAFKMNHLMDLFVQVNVF